MDLDPYGIIGFLSNLAGIISLIVFVWVTIRLFMTKRDIEKKMIAFDKCENNGLSKRPVAIVIGIGKNPLGSVEKFLADNNWSEVPLIEWNSGGFLQPGDYPKAMIEINGLRTRALEMGMSEVLLFYAGPNDISMFVGFSFSDWVPVKIFSFTDSGTYEYRITLGRQAARLVSIAEELPRELEGKP